MSRTITAWVVYGENGQCYATFDNEHSAEEYASTAGRFVVEMTGQLPDPPKTVTINNMTWEKRPDGRWQILGDPFLIQSDPPVFLDRIWELENGGES